MQWKPRFANRPVLVAAQAKIRIGPTAKRKPVLRLTVRGERRSIAATSPRKIIRNPKPTTPPHGPARA